MDKSGNNSSIELTLARVPAFLNADSDEIIEKFVNKSDNLISVRNISLSEKAEKVITRVDLKHPLVRKTAATIVANVSGDLTIDQICAIYDYIKYGNKATNTLGWNYISEPIWMDVCTYANETIELGAQTNHSGIGDCDDFAILMASLIEAIGGTSKVIIAYENGTGHAFAEAYVGQIGVNNNDILTIDQWLKQNYRTNEIRLRFDEITYEVWLNLDWGKDENGQLHPGGPYVPLKHYLSVDIQRSGLKSVVQPPENYINSIEWNRKGIGFQIAGKYNDAIRCYEEAIELDPKYSATWNNKAIAIYQNKLPTTFSAVIRDINSQSNYQRALDCLNTSIDLNPNLATAWYNKGLILYLQGKYYNSMECFEKAIDLRSSYPQAWNNKGLTLFKGALAPPIDLMLNSASENALILDQFNREPTQCFENALKMDPSLAEAWNNAGVANYQNAECTKYFDKAIDLGFVSAFNNKARVYDFWQRDDEAMILYNNALKLDPDNSIIWKNRGNIDRTHSGIHYRDMGYIGLILTPSPPMLAT
ncbi:MAG: tetratricopeptide repeat protein [Methanothrix sp.]|nr:tetratricopeptide repeat protein [Methanothrix sp.]